jgi:hypothetical protein
MVAEPLLLETAVEQFLDIVMNSTYFRWALLLFVVAVVGSLISGLLDIALMVAQYGTVVLVVLGILEFVAPGLLAAILNALPL